MGDRANVHIIDEDGGSIFLYTHWDGSRLPETLRLALARGESRTGNGAYLTRVIFSEMIKDDVLAETGYGISTRVGDGGDRILTVDMRDETVDGMPFKEYVTEARSWSGRA